MDAGPNKTLKTLQMTGLATSLAASGGPSRGLVLRIESGPDEGRSVALGARKLAIGAGADNDIVLVDDAVSRHHAEVHPARGGALVRDLGSTNGTHVAGARIQEVLVAAGGELTVGSTRIRVLDGGGPRVPPSERDRFGGLLGTSRVMREVFAVLELAAPTDATVLLEGPSGTGKELCARALHDHSARAPRPFIVFDCGAVEKDLLKSALMGHKKGAFTGADRERAGAFVEADGGTLFLDEVGELPLEAQTFLLRALESSEVIPVGGDRARKIDVRVVAATNRDLFAMVEAGTFRLDLFHRLAVVHVRMPGLRDRIEDLPALVRGFYEGRGFDPGPIVGENLEALRAHPFVGNVRELRNILERSWVLAGETKEFQALPLWLGPRADSPRATAFEVDVGLPFKEAKEEIVERFEAAYLPELLARTSGNISQAAKHAGLSRRHLRALMDKHGLRERDE
jgi:DNA-binding NtrC family response regulator